GGGRWWCGQRQGPARLRRGCRRGAGRGSPEAGPSRRARSRPCVSAQPPRHLSYVVRTCPHPSFAPQLMEGSMPRVSKWLAGSAMLATAALAWGGMFAVAKPLMGEVDPFAFNLVRYGLAA